MTTLKLVNASEIGVKPLTIEGATDLGITYRTWHGSKGVGAQCANCNTILWTDARRNHILNEKVPIGIPSSGAEYRSYYLDNLSRFLKSLPPCPHCNSQNYDLFINNAVIPRLSSGWNYSKLNGQTLTPHPDHNMKVWWYEES